MSNDLAQKTEGFSLASMLPTLPENFDVIESSRFALLRLYDPRSKSVMENKIRGGHWGIKRGSNIEDVGPKITLIPLWALRKALDMNNLVARYVDSDAQAKADPEYRRIVAQSAIKDSNCMSGPEFLVYIPHPFDVIGVFFANSKTAKNAVDGTLTTGIGRPFNGTCQTFRNDKYTWYGPQFEMAKDFSMDLPDGFSERIQQEIEKFKAQTLDEIKVGGEGEEEQRDR